jgi:hypothetical protein
MHMSVSKRAASTRRLPAMVLAAACGVGLLLPATVNTATAIEPAVVETTANKLTPSDVLPTRSEQHEPGAMPGAEASPSQATVLEASGPVVSAQVLRALLSDPAIRTFVGTAENAWDFTQPESIPGFGRLP